MTTALLLFAAGLIVGVLLDRWRERRYWRRMFLRTFTRPPMIVTPPTVTELREPDWGANLVDCPMCDGAAMSQAALNEHLRVRHGDS